MAWVALGSNLGDPARQLQSAARALARLGHVARRSSLWRTRPVGGPGDQPPYLNAVLALRPSAENQDPAALLERLLSIEQEHGRIRRRRWQARTLDLDLLAFGRRVVRAPGLELPHPRMMARAFVLAPLAEIAPEWRHPVDGRRAVDALRALGPLEAAGVQRTELAWDDP